MSPQPALCPAVGLLHPGTNLFPRRPGLLDFAYAPDKDLQFHKDLRQS